ncbi:MAG TPA: hypothetical protein VKB79_01105 [Bryobacteraceae bacterium]|nr:hypothetical protein [Bryobacteraceae bacterium]
MKRVIRFSAWIAAAAAIFLIYSSLDNIPDVPGMLNSKSNRTLLAQGSHHATPDVPRACIISISVPAPIPDMGSSAGAPSAVVQTMDAETIHQAANLPPPTV